MTNLRYSTQTISKEDIANVSKVLKSELLTQGPRTEEFENKIKDMIKLGIESQKPGDDDDSQKVNYLG